MDNRPSNQYCKVGEVAKFFGVCNSTVYKWIYDGLMPTITYTFELPVTLGEKPIRRYFFHNKDIYKMDEEGREKFKLAVSRRKYPRLLKRSK